MPKIYYTASCGIRTWWSWSSIFSFAVWRSDDSRHVPQDIWTCSQLTLYLFLSQLGFLLKMTQYIPNWINGNVNPRQINKNIKITSFSNGIALKKLVGSWRAQELYIKTANQQLMKEHWGPHMHCSTSVVGIWESVRRENIMHTSIAYKNSIFMAEEIKMLG